MPPRSNLLAKSKLHKTVEAFTVIREQGGWQAVRFAVDLTTNTVTVVEKSEIDMKPIATERFKVWVGKHWGKLYEQSV